MKRQQIIALALIILGVVTAAGIILYANRSQEPDFSDYETVYPEPGYEVPNNEEPPQEPEPFPIVEEDSTDYSQYYVGTIQQDGVEWLDHPELVGTLGLIGGSYYVKADSRLYYKIGSDHGHDIIATIAPCDGMCLTDNVAIFLENGHGYYLLTRHAEQESSYSLSDLSNDVEPRGDITYNALVFPDTLKVSGELFRARSLSPEGFFSNLIPKETTNTFPKQVWEFEAQTEYGPLFRSGSVIENGPSQLVKEVLRLPGGLAVAYYPEYSFVGDDGVPNVTWLDGSQNTRAYKTDSQGGCGSWGRVEIIDASQVSEDDVRIIGFTIDQKPIYGFTSEGSPVVEKFFNITGGQYFQYDQETHTSVSKSFTKADILNEHLLFLYKDALGRYVVFSSTEHAPAAECAKPVIYLYPQNPTKVSVKVGAHITNSEPSYENGWRVLAKPDGSLVDHSQTYDSLFWDGVGLGEYPNIQKGFVVPRDNVESTILDHLNRLGLNKKESQDFLEFWLPHMPKTPYVRLSWLMTRDMDMLAPLEVTPRPDTVIRVFLDFEGLNEYINMPPQELISKERTGFTLVEWGGLLVR